MIQLESLPLCCTLVSFTHTLNVYVLFSAHNGIRSLPRTRHTGKIPRDGWAAKTRIPFYFIKKKKKIFRNKEQRPLRIILLFSSVVRHFFCCLFLSIRKCSISKKCKFGLRGMGHPPSTCHFLFFLVLFCFVLWLFFLFLSCGQIRIIPDFSSTVCPPFFFQFPCWLVT